MQRPQDPSRSPSPPVESPSISLRFPTIPVHGTPASWGSHSQIVTMTSTHDESGDDATSSLGDSSYDFIEDQSNATTDDEDQDAMTASTTSSDGHAFEQINLPPQGHTQQDPITQSSPGQNTTAPPDQEKSPHVNHVSSSQDPLQMVTDAESHHGSDTIEFDEPSITNLNALRLTEVSHTISIIDKDSRPHESHHKLLERLKGHLAVTVRQTMTSRTLSLNDGKYKVMYVGDPEARDSIVQKIGTALAATMKSSPLDPESPRSSRFNIVPISVFGEESSPEVVLIDSSGLELIVEDCHHASFTRRQGSRDTLSLALSNRTTVHSTWDGSKFAVSSNWRLPDLAIFCLPDHDDTALKKVRQSARSFMSRHKIPSIVISRSLPQDGPPTEPIDLDYMTPHLCLESRKSSFVHTQVIRRYPIDLATFLKIDGGQMNRNLACITPSLSATETEQEPRISAKDIKSLPANGFWSARELFESMVVSVQKDGLGGLNRFEYIAGIALALISLFGMVVLGVGLTGFLNASRVSTSRVFPTQASVASTPGISTLKTLPTVPLPQSSALAASSNSPTSVPAQFTSTKSLSTNTDLASFLLDAYTLAPNQSDLFKVHVLGDCHIVLKPPQWLSKLKKRPKLFFNILRGDSKLEHQETTLFDGVYALQVSREDAYGILNVTVWTNSKPKVNERFEVDFGSSWLKVAGWKKATHALTDSIRGDIGSISTSLSTVYDSTKTGLSTFVQHQRERAAAQKSAEGALLRSHLAAARKTKDLIIGQTKDLQRTLSKRIQASQERVSVKISRRAEDFSRDLIVYTRSTTSRFSQQARHLIHVATKTDVKAWFGGAEDFRRKHLRETQKKALKAWWRVRGVPQQRQSKVKGRARRGPPPFP